MKSYLTFKHKEFSKSGKTQIFDVFSGPESNEAYLLGQVKWYGPWRKYCFFPNGATIFDKNCLTEIINFIEEQMSTRK